MWLVPSKPIREQTLRALKNRHHPYHTALREAGPITVLELDEAKSVTRATMDTSTVVIVATRQAFQLKAEEMIKLPVILETEPDWQQCLGYAIARREALHALADTGRRAGENYLRPVVLIQSEPRRQNIETLDVERVYKELTENHRIPAAEIIIATGEVKGLEKIDAEYKQGIADPDCPVKYVITQRALAEGWDCPFAYILVSMASLHSATAVEQLLGRVLRQPEARRRASKQLNQSYAFVVSRNFADTASALRDRLVSGAGFERREVADFVKAAKSEQGRLDVEGQQGRIVVTPVDVPLTEKPNFKGVPKSLRDKVSWDSKRKTLTINAPLAEDETEALASTVKTATAVAAINQAAEISRTSAIEFFQTPAELGESFQVPQLQLRVQGKLQSFDDPELLDYPWDLSVYDAAPSADDLGRLGESLKVSEGGEIDVDEESGDVVTRFIPNLQRDLGLVYTPENWDKVKLVAWLCRNLPEPESTHEQKQAFVAAWIKALLDRPEFNLSKVNLLKFQIRNLIERCIRELRRETIVSAYQQALFEGPPVGSVAVNAATVFEFHPLAYAPVQDYDGRFEPFAFRRHFYGRIGDFDSKEEFECACWLDTQAQKGRIKFWVRNLVRREGCSFFLQKADGRFYPDFLCLLNDGVILVVEYKGGDRWTNAEDDRLIGGLWAELSDGACQFIMLKNSEWYQIENII